MKYSLKEISDKNLQLTAELNNYQNYLDKLNKRIELITEENMRIKDQLVKSANEMCV